MRQGSDDGELKRRYRSARPLGRELLLAGAAAATVVLWLFELTPYPSTNLVGLALGLLIGAVVSYTIRLPAIEARSVLMDQARRGLSLIVWFRKQLVKLIQ